MSTKSSSAVVPLSRQLTSAVGQLVSVDEYGRPWVEFDAAPTGPILSMSTIQLSPTEADACPQVLLNFINDDVQQPIIVGVISSTIINNTTVRLSDSDMQQASVDGKKLSFDAKDAIEFTCGKSSITLNKNGRISLKGVEITSRAERNNKIKGGNIRLN